MTLLSYEADSGKWLVQTDYAPHVVKVLAIADEEPRTCERDNHGKVTMIRAYLDEEQVQIMAKRLRKGAAR